MSDAVETAVVSIKKMIRDLALMPGQRIGQESVAEELSISRAPVREALRLLQSDGVVVHEKNVGYSVRRLTASELRQVYSMREVLEEMLLRGIPREAEIPVDRLREMNEEMRVLGDAGRVDEMRELNQVWHFLILELSPLDIVRQEVLRLWDLSHAYRSYYLYDGASRQRVVEEHNAIIEALEQRDIDRLVEVSRTHRAAVTDEVRRGDLLKPVKGSAFPGTG